MAQKSAKQLATKNTAKLKQTHLITFLIHAMFLSCMFTFRRSLRRTPYLVLSAPALALEYWLDTLARPKHDASGNLVRAGEDLDAPGLTEFMWDIIYWTWINLVLVAVVGNRGWWAWVVVPGYAAYKAFATVKGVRGALGGMSGADGDDALAAAGAQSKRQQKIEKKGGQRTVRR